ncbi:MAG: class I SAM-dependent methyltransferase [Candidatus Competibacteraceae bacterium]|jgi:SAM-dependent methyltransferase|nr:class I SAM-dependent methyltransferase [Candidatus Competibacteraceae bacterium]
MTDDLATSYDEIPYPGRPYPQSHPDRLATLAKLHGLQPPPVSGSRVLELGCADGSNIIPWAESLPNAQFVGIDFSAQQIAQGQHQLVQLGLNNIRLCQLDIAGFDKSLGPFDYVVAHGVYSWVPPAIQERVLAICSEHLAPNGIAYISYNTYPGWHQRGLLRKLMLRYSANSGYADRPKQAREVLTFLKQALPEDDNPHADSLRATGAEMSRLDDHFLLHDELELENHPLYFHEFVERAEAFGLSFLSEAEFHTNPHPDFAADLPVWCERGGERWLEGEQWFDVVNHRMFRQSLLCHADALLDRTVDSQRIHSLYVAAPLSATSNPVNCSDYSPVTFHHPNGTQLDITVPFIGIALHHLQRCWPQAIAFRSLVNATQQRIAAGGAISPNDAGSLLAEFLLLAYRQNLIELHSLPSPFVRTPNQYPIANPLARLQAGSNSLVTGRQHKAIGLDIFHRRLLQLLDGSRDIPMLIEQLSAEIMNGQLDLGQQIPGDKLAMILEKQIPVCLERLAQGGLLIA